jgi:hypothetical protein
MESSGNNGFFPVKHNKTSVQIEGMSIDSTDGLQALAQKMELIGLDEKY